MFNSGRIYDLERKVRALEKAQPTITVHGPNKTGVEWDRYLREDIPFSRPQALKLPVEEVLTRVMKELNITLEYIPETDYVEPSYKLKKGRAKTK